jgi:peptide/nickel transport system permease protein
MPLLKLLLRRLLGMFITLAAVSVIVFVIMELPPGDYAERYAYRKFSGSLQTITASDLQNLRAQFGLDRPAPERYFNWIRGIVLRFDFGPSFAFDTSVNQLIGERLALTLVLLFSTLLLTYAVAVPLGIYAATHRHSLLDHGLTVLSYLGFALPNFLVALVLLYLSVTLFGGNVGGLFSPEFRDAPWSLARVVDLAQHLVLPAVVLAWSATAFALQTVRSTMSDELPKLYVTAARARGLSERRVVWRHPTRIALNPLVSTISFDMNRIFSELPIVALVLGLPELGELLIRSYIDLDMYVAGAILLLLTVAVVVMNFLSDLLLMLLDPRTRQRSAA